MDKNSSKLISCVRFPLALGVVFIHSSQALNWKLSQPFEVVISKYVYALFSTIIPSVCVPFFFLMSGYLFYQNIEKYESKFHFFRDKYKKRFLSLFVPFVLWNLIPVLILLIKGEGISFDSVPSFFWDYSNKLVRSNVFGWEYIFSTPINGPLWFIRDLIVSVVVSPLILFFIKRTKIWGIFILGVIYVFSLWPNTIFLMQGISLFYFSLGCYFSLHNKSLYSNGTKPLYLAIYVILSLLLPIIQNYIVLEVFLITIHLYSIYSIFVLLMIVSAIIRKNYTFPAFFSWGGIGFFIFSAHTIYVNVLFGNYLLPFIIPGDNIIVWIFRYFLLPISICVFLVFVYYALKETFPKILGVFVGGRL